MVGQPSTNAFLEAPSGASIGANEAPDGAIDAAELQEGNDR